MGSEGEEAITLTTPGLTFQGGSNKQTSKAKIKDIQVRFELKGGAAYDIPVSKLFTITPQLTFGYGLTNVVKDVKWKILTFQLMSSVKFNLM